jgi:hypothetical protein
VTCSGPSSSSSSDCWKAIIWVSPTPFSTSPASLSLSLVRRPLQLLFLLLPRSSSFLNSLFWERLSILECTGRWGRGSFKP